MGKDVVKDVDREVEVPGVAPRITKDMIETALDVLEAEGLVHYMKGGAYMPTEAGWKLLRGIKPAKEVITAYGHSGIVAKDENCFEITTNKDPKGEDCVLAVRADKSCYSLSEEFKDSIKSASKVFITIRAGGLVEKITAYGSPALSLTDKNEIVVRKSDYINGKTAAILADKSANQMSNDIKEKLKDSETEVEITFEIK
jgi:hypothetical protein